jgi:chromatin assembly factor 1 subunit A
MRLSSWFASGAPSTPSPLSDAKTLKASPSPSKHVYLTKVDAVRRSMSLERESPLASVPMINLTTSNTVEQENKRRWLPYVKKKRVTLAPENRYLASADELDACTFTDKLDAHRVARGYAVPQVRDVIAQIQGSFTNPIDLTAAAKETAMERLQSIPMKYHFFGQDVRPRYFGTWTKPVAAKEARLMARNPLYHRSDVDYEYDSEAEWDDAPGENLDSEGEGEESDDGEEDMEDFLDDDDAAKAKKSMIPADLEPVATGLHWPDVLGILQPADPNDAVQDFSECEMVCLLGKQTYSKFYTAWMDQTFRTSFDVSNDFGYLIFRGWQNPWAIEIDTELAFPSSIGDGLFQ